jgi:hypothetical protein
MDYAEQLSELIREAHEWSHSRVPAYLFKQSGKYKYSVFLDYTGILNLDGTPVGGESRWMSPSAAALKALEQATKNGTSDVSLERPGSYHLVVPNPPTGFPVMVMSRETEA